MRIKVCGLTSIEQMHQLGDIGVQFAGMIFYAPSPRFVVKHRLAAADVRRSKLKPYKVGVFVNAAYDEIMSTVDAYGLDMVQLHGDELPYLCDKVANNIQVIKAFRFSADAHLELMIRGYHSCCDMFLFDTGSKNSFGGTGRKFDWQILKGTKINKPFFLSGGIEPSDAQSIKAFMKETVAKDLFAVDINSRFETSPGIKDMTLIKNFVRELNEETNPG
jgi:phosphoribosylanthranilate isomerase